MLAFGKEGVTAGSSRLPLNFQSGTVSLCPSISSVSWKERGISSNATSRGAHVDCRRLLQGRRSGGRVRDGRRSTVHKEQQPVEGEAHPRLGDQRISRGFEIDRSTLSCGPRQLSH